MVEPIVHYLAPTLILLSILPNKKRVLILSPLAIVPDLDFIIGHRYLFHNLFFVFGVTLIVALYFRSGPQPILAFYFLFSHLLLDTFGPGVGFFYPIYPRLFRFDFFIYTSPEKGGVSVEGDIVTQALEEATKDQLSPAVTPLGIMLLVLVFIGLSLVIVMKERLEE